MSFVDIVYCPYCADKFTSNSEQYVNHLRIHNAELERIYWEKKLTEIPPKTKLKKEGK